MFSEKNGWCVPIMTMEESERSRASKKSECRERKSLLTELYHCKKCNTVYQGALSSKKISTGGKYKEDHYSLSVMPTLYLEKKECLRCKL
tara:strand:+ start:306 stop:575 length:270 start_codon:yes stop_codon:yes gene_type:complete